MNAEKIKNLCKQILDAQVIRLTYEGDDNEVAICVSSIVGTPDNEVIRLFWSTTDEDYSIKITEQGLDEAAYYGNTIELDDHEGDHIILHLFELKPITVK